MSLRYWSSDPRASKKRFNKCFFSESSPAFPELRYVRSKNCMLFLEKKSQASFRSRVRARLLSFSSLEVIFLGRFADDPEVVDPDSPAPETGPCFLFGCPADPSVGALEEAYHLDHNHAHW
jgi:hypothetical protein